MVGMTRHFIATIKHYRIMKGQGSEIYIRLFLLPGVLHWRRNRCNVDWETDTRLTESDKTPEHYFSKWKMGRH
jgi:hypothetical protein